MLSRKKVSYARHSSHMVLDWTHSHRGVVSSHSSQADWVGLVARFAGRAVGEGWGVRVDESQEKRERLAVLLVGAGARTCTMCPRWDCVKRGMLFVCSADGMATQTSSAYLESTKYHPAPKKSGVAPSSVGDTLLHAAPLTLYPTVCNSACGCCAQVFLMGLQVCTAPARSVPGCWMQPPNPVHGLHVCCC